LKAAAARELAGGLREEVRPQRYGALVRAGGTLADHQIHRASQRRSAAEELLDDHARIGAARGGLHQGLAGAAGLRLATADLIVVRRTPTRERTPIRLVDTGAWERGPGVRGRNHASVGSLAVRTIGRACQRRAPRQRRIAVGAACERSGTEVGIACLGPEAALIARAADPCSGDIAAGASVANARVVAAVANAARHTVGA